jgi:hypothetical protein
MRVRITAWKLLCKYAVRYFSRLSCLILERLGPPPLSVCFASAVLVCLFAAGARVRGYVDEVELSCHIADGFTGERLLPQLLERKTTQAQGDDVHQSVCPAALLGARHHLSARPIMPRPSPSGLIQAPSQLTTSSRVRVIYANCRSSSPTKSACQDFLLPDWDERLPRSHDV